MRKLNGFLLAVCVTAAGQTALAEELVEIETPRGVSQKFLLDVPDQAPTAIVVLFAGGKGALNLGKGLLGPSIRWGRNNFLVRTRQVFVKNGFVTVTVDAPSDRQGSKGMYGGYRTSSDHVTDIDSVIATVRAMHNLPVWLVGTSRGTESAAYLGINSAQRPAGVVLTSSMTEKNAKGVAVTDLPLQRIGIPVLITHHRNDGCRWTQPAGAGRIRDRLGAAPVVDLQLFDGGSERSGPCKAMSYHGYLGIEEKVVTAIAIFIRANS